MRRAVLAALLVALAALAGCTGFGGPLDRYLGEDPDDDRIGWENGYWYDEPVAVTTGDGLNASEREALLARTMARVEVIRDREFTVNVTLSVISRAEYRNRSAVQSVEDDPWNEQVWEALLLVGEDTSVDAAFDDALGASVQGYYAPGNDSIVIVSDAAAPTIDRATLAHELVHALQDQSNAFAASPETQDQQLARRSVTEGEANLVQALYERRCQERWNCVARPTPDGGNGGATLGGVFLVLYQPYAEGPGFVADVRRSGGWDAVTALYDDPPASTEQVIHPAAYPGDEPTDVTVPDRSNAAWARFDHDPVADTVGEASVYAMLYARGAVSPDAVYAYESGPSAGWDGDSLVPYRNGSGGYGYVWQSVWDTERDAREFADAYRSILVERGASHPSPNVHVLPESDPYGDAFRVTRDGQRVTIVNAPTRDALNAVHGPR